MGDGPRDGAWLPLDPGGWAFQVAVCVGEPEGGRECKRRPLRLIVDGYRNPDEGMRLLCMPVCSRHLPGARAWWGALPGDSDLNEFPLYDVADVVEGLADFTEENPGVPLAFPQPGNWEAFDIWTIRPKAAL